MVIEYDDTMRTHTIHNETIKMVLNTFIFDIRKEKQNDNDNTNKLMSEIEMGHTKKMKDFRFIAYLCVKWSDAWLSFEEPNTKTVVFFFFFLMIRLFRSCKMSAIFQLKFAKDDTFINFLFCVLNCNRGCEFQSLRAQNLFIPIRILVILICSLNRKKENKRKKMCVTKTNKNRMSNKNKGINFSKSKTKFSTSIFGDNVYFDER